MCNLIVSRDQIFVKGYGFLFFAKNMGKNIGRNISKNLNVKYSPVVLNASQKLFDHAKQSTTVALNTAWKKLLQKNNRSNWWLASQELHHRIVQGQKWNRKYLGMIKKDIYLQKEDGKLLMILD